MERTHVLLRLEGACCPLWRPRADKKLPYYNTQNLLARSLHSQAYDHNPGFLQFIQRSGIKFRPHEEFKKADLDERGELYRRLAQQVWNPDHLLENAER